MIYELKTNFTKIEETEGMLENKSAHTPVEIVMADSTPEKETGFELQPKEKLPFKVKDGQSLYARAANFEHSVVNLVVANFNVPVSGSVGTGTSGEVIFSGEADKVGTYTLSKSIQEFKFILIKTGGDIAETLLFVNKPTIGFTVTAYANQDYNLEITGDIKNNILRIDKVYFLKGWYGIQQVIGIK